MNTTSLPGSYPESFESKLRVFVRSEVLACIGALLLLLVWSTRRAQKDVKLQIPTKPGIFYLGTPAFFRDPPLFISECLEWAQGSMFSFEIRGHIVVMLRGVSGKNAMFTKGLDFMSGYRLLNPQLVDVMPAKKLTGDESWAGFFAQFLSSEALSPKIHLLLSDTCTGMAGWGDDGSIDPFDDVNELVFGMASRVSACHDICATKAKLEALVKIFARLDAGSTPSAIILPWIPTPARVRRLLAGRDLYMMIRGIVHQRRKDGKVHDDPMQTLMDMDLSLPEITRFIATTLFAAVTNTSAVLAWLFIFIQINPIWKEQIQHEIDEFVGTHCTSSTSSLQDSLSEVPISAWDSGTPLLDLCINETLRLILTGTIMRRNIGDDIVVDGNRLKHGTFLMYPSQDLHFHRDLYPNPEVFDPLRWEQGPIEERTAKTGLSFLGWGAKPHICVGKRVALLMMRIIVVCVMHQYDTVIVDADGQALQVQPERYLHLFKVGFTKDPVRLKYSRRSRG